MEDGVAEAVQRNSSGAAVPNIHAVIPWRTSRMATTQPFIYWRPPFRGVGGRSVTFSKVTDGEPSPTACGASASITG